MKLKALMSGVLMCLSIVTTPSIIIANSDIGIDSPIDKVYAGQEFVLFLHKDTSISGFGANVNNTLGKSGGYRFNTGEIEKVSGPTGFKYIKTSKGYAHGFRPLVENENLYEWYQIGPTLTKVVNEPVKDASITGRAGVYENPHDTSSYVTADGQVKSSGSDYWIHLGVGKGYPFGRYNYSTWQYVLGTEDKQTTILNTFSNEDNSATLKNVVSNEFTSDGSPITINVQYRDVVNHITKTTLNIKLLNSSGEIVYSNLTPYNQVANSAYSNYVELPVYNLQAGNYKLDITSANTKWDISVKNRVHFKEATKVFRATESSSKFIIVNNQGTIFFHDTGYGYVKEVVFPTGVKIDTNTITSGMGNYFAMIDTQGRAWTLNGITPTLISVPTLGSYNFYDVYTVKKVSVGLNFTMMLVENKITKETEVWNVGGNNLGQLGIGDIGTTLKDDFILPDGSTFTYNVNVTSNMNTAVRVNRKGKPISNIQDIAAGANFSIIVQNITDGQLVWTSGSNNRGQLGGGISLSIKEPQLVPGLSNIKKVITQNTVQVLAISDDKIYSFGGNNSYPFEFTMPYGLGMIDDWQQHTTNYWRQELTTVPTSASVVIKDGIPYGIGYVGYGALGASSQGGKIRIANAFIGDSSLGREPSDLYFNNIKSASTSNMSGGVVDKNGRLWGWGYVNSAGLGDNQYDLYGPDGITWIGSTYAHPMVLSDNQVAPTIFKQYAGVFNNGGYALTDNGKIWVVGRYVSPINSSYNINSVNIVKLFTGLSNNISALDDAGNVWRWSYNGIPTKIDSSKFQNRKIVDISEGNNHALFLDELGYVWAIGDNSFGKLGDGTENNASNPVKVLNVTESISIEAGIDFSYAVDKKGRVWAWGYSAYGSLGNNFTLSRNTISTAVGNELPEISVLNAIKDYYLSENGNKTFKLYGTLKEKERETTNIKTTILGVEKQAKVDSSEWELDMYDQVKPKEWNVEVNIDEIGNEQIFQSLLKVSAEDDRGGIVEQFFSSKIIIDNEKPQPPNWGDTCIIDKTLGEVCYGLDYFKMNGTNGVDKPVRIYMNPIQKSGDYKAPVGVQIQYRIKQPYGYPSTWSEWIDVKTSNSKGYYYDFFQGFLGETQIKMRAKDLAGNTSDENADYRYVIIANAGAEIKDISVENKSIENKLVSEIKVTASSPSSSALKSFGVSRRALGSTIWTNLTSSRVPWQGTGEQIYTDATEDLLGNYTYEYMVDAENTVAVGKGKIAAVITYPYEPINFIRKVDTNGITFTIKQDERNRGTILYRLVLVDNKTGQIYTKDKTSENIKEEVIYDIKEGDAPFSITNNSITVKLLIQGENKKFLTIVYDDNFENSPSVMEDINPPEAFMGIEGNPERIIDDGINKINLVFSATDDVSPNNKIKVQFSPDGTKWYGQKLDGSWVLNTWSDYKSLYTGFSMGTTVGSRVVYARIKDEAGNIGNTNTPILISQLVQRDDNVFVVDKNRNIISRDTLHNQIHLNNAYIYLTVPKTGNMKEVQYSFDGVKWSPWEKLNDGDNTKFINLPPYEGEHTIMIRYRNELGDITRLKEDYDIIKYVLDKEKPSLQAETNNGTYIVKNDSIILLLTPIDNLSEKVNLKFSSSQYQYFVNGVQVQDSMFENNMKQAVFVKGLVDGFNIINIEITDMAGNKTLKNIRVFRK